METSLKCSEFQRRRVGGNLGRPRLQIPTFLKSARRHRAIAHATFIVQLEKLRSRSARVLVMMANGDICVTPSTPAVMQAACETAMLGEDMCREKANTLIRKEHMDPTKSPILVAQPRSYTSCEVPPITIQGPFTPCTNVISKQRRVPSAPRAKRQHAFLTRTGHPLGPARWLQFL